MARKIVLAVLLTAVVALPAFAAVQNVKVNGELRFRAYNRHILRSISSGSVTAATSTSADPIQEDWTEQRTRVNLSADLNDNVSTYIRLQNNRNWGNGNATNTTESLDNAYLKLGDALNTMGVAGIPLDVYLGRQDLYYGNSFIMGTNTPYDAVRLAMDMGPLVVDYFAAKTTESYAGTSAKNADSDTMGIYASYTGIEKITLQPYLIARWDNTADTNETRRSFGMLMMADDLIQDLSLWVEPVVQRGADANLKVKAFALDAGAQYTFSQVTYKPWLSFEYIYGSGDNNANDTIDKTYDQIDNDFTYGEVFGATLSNINIYNVNAGLQLTDDLAVTFNYYHLRQAKKEDTYGTTESLVTGLDNATNTSLGNEYDLYLDYQYTEDVSTQICWAYFDPGSAFPSAVNDGQYIVRGEVSVSF